MDFQNVFGRFLNGQLSLNCISCFSQDNGEQKITANYRGCFNNGEDEVRLDVDVVVTSEPSRMLSLGELIEMPVENISANFN